ncbi:MAG: CinA family protein [Beijerinckiaceae bacterium]|nr:CinA family protein [Beijerinckiaceae bacterium]
MLTGAGVAEAEALFALYRKHRLTFATAESCTGGLVAALITAIPGSSAVFDRGFVTYSNAAKTECLGVPADMIAHFGAVSTEVACAMAIGTLDHSPADVAVSITGIAGPDGGSIEKPIGLVHFACLRRGRPPIAAERRFGPIGRSQIRTAAVFHAFKMLTDATV